MNFLSSLSSTIIAAGTSALAGGGGIPGVPGYAIGEKVTEFEGKTIWSLYEGTKKVSLHLSRKRDWHRTRVDRLELKHV